MTEFITLPDSLTGGTARVPRRFRDLWRFYRAQGNDRFITLEIVMNTLHGKKWKHVMQWIAVGVCALIVFGIIADAKHWPAKARAWIELHQQRASDLRE